MNKKFIRILMFAAVAASMGSFVSCKDTNEDLRTELEEKIAKLPTYANLEEALEQQGTALQGQIDDTKGLITKLEQLVGDQTPEGKTLSGFLEETNQQLQDLIDDINGTSSPGEKSAIEKKIENTINNITFPTGSTGGSSEVTIAEFIQQEAGANAAIELLKGTVETMQTQLDNIKECSCGDFTEKWNTLADLAETMPEVKATADEAKQLASTNKSDIASLQADFDKLDETYATLDALTALEEGKVKDALDNASTALSKAEANETYIESIKTPLATAFTDIEDLKDKVSDLETACEQIGVNTGDITELKAKVATLEDDMDEYKGKVETLETEVATLKTTCETNLAEAKAYADQEIATAKTSILNEVGTLLEDYYNKSETDSKLSDLENNIQIKLDDFAITVTENATAIGNNATAIGNNATAIGNNATAISANAKAIEDINKALENIKSCECEPVDLQPLVDRLTAAEGNISDNAAAIEDIKKEITDVINANITTLTTNLSELTGTVGTVQTDLGNLTTKVDNLNYITPEDVQDMIDIVVAKAKADSTVLANGTKSLSEEMKKELQTVSDSLTKHFNEIAQLQAITKTLDNTTVKIDDYTLDKEAILNSISANETSIGTLSTRVTEVENRVDALESGLQALQDRVTKTEEDIATLQEDMEDIKSDVSALQEALAKQVTGIIIQAVSNPSFGSISTPFDVQANILVAYYGMPANDVEFPTSRTSNYVRPDEALTAEDMAMLGDVDIFESDANIPMTFEDGYAGKVYMTINPNTADLEGLKLDIVNSQDEVSPITLSPLKKSDTTLKFGFTRAANNGFYEADAQVTPANVLKTQEVSIDYSALKDAVQEIAQNRTGADLKQIAGDLVDAARNLHMDRSGLRCTYTENEQEHSVYSDYNMAVIAYQPLSLTTLKDLNVTSLPGYERVNNLLNRISNTVHSKVHTFFYNVTNNEFVEKLANFQIKEITIPELTDDDLQQFVLHMDTTFVMDGLSYHLELPITETIPIKFSKDLEIPVKFTGDDALETTVNVDIPVTIDKDVEIDLSKFSVTVPTVVIGGTATGKASTQALDEDGNPLYDSNGNPIMISTMVIPVKDDANNVVGYTTINLNEIYVEADIDAEGTVDEKIILKDSEGKSIATVPFHYEDVIKTSATGKVEIDKTITYHLEIEDSYEFKTTVIKDFYFGDNGTDKKYFNLWFNYDMTQAAQDLYGKATEAIEDINSGLLDDVRDLLEEANEALSMINRFETTVNTTIDNYINKIQSYLEKINNKATSLINSTNSRLQPVMIANCDEGIKTLSGSKSYPTVLPSTVMFWPTSYTMELIVPLARKHVAVTNVFKGEASAQAGDSDCRAKLKAINAQPDMNTVLDGTRRRAEASGFEPGYVYEIAYSAVDFQGKIATRKYYITVKQ